MRGPFPQAYSSTINTILYLLCIRDKIQLSSFSCVRMDDRCSSSLNFNVFLGSHFEALILVIYFMCSLIYFYLSPCSRCESIVPLTFLIRLHAVVQLVSKYCLSKCMFFSNLKIITYFTRPNTSEQIIFFFTCEYFVQRSIYLMQLMTMGHLWLYLCALCRRKIEIHILKAFLNTCSI